MPDPNRRIAGFSSMDGGMDGGRDDSLIKADQAVLLVNTTVRGSFIKTRPPYNRITFNSSAVTARWTGTFQGHARYSGGPNSPGGWIISRGGNLFFLTDDTFTLNEITPKVNITTAADFVPTSGNPVTIQVNDSFPFSAGQTIKIDSGTYVVVSVFIGSITANYTGGAAHATCNSGTAILDSNGVQIVETQSNPAGLDFVFIFQAETYGIILAQNQPTLIFDGIRCRRAGPTEVPSAILGAYGWGRIWLTLNDRKKFIAGNLVNGGATGTTADILSFTENQLFAQGGAFAVPANAGLITSMQFLATQDTSLGVGVLLVGTENMVFSVNAPVDRTIWKNLTFPIQTISLLDYGPMGPLNAVPVNGDMWYRSQDGVRSFSVSRRDFGVPGNVPLSREISSLIDQDTLSLLFYGSGVLFDNRLLLTVSPMRTSLGVAHQGLIVVNYDLVSTLGSKTNPAWEGAWTGLNTLQISKATIQGVERCFLFVQGTDVELWELLGDGDGTADVNGAKRVPIQSIIETRSENYGNALELDHLHMLEMYVDQIVDNVNIVVKFQPDQYPDFFTWGTISFCANVSQCTFTSNVNGVCQTWKPFAPQYAARVTLGLPPDNVCNAISNTPVDQGREFQFRLECTGSWRIRRFYTHAYVMMQEMEGDCPPAAACTAFQSCGLPIFGIYDAHGI